MCLRSPLSSSALQGLFNTLSLSLFFSSINSLEASANHSDTGRGNQSTCFLHAPAALMDTIGTPMQYTGRLHVTFAASEHRQSERHSSNEAAHHGLLMLIRAVKSANPSTPDTDFTTWPLRLIGHAHHALSITAEQQKHRKP